jgi:hypothetical protein
MPLSYFAYGTSLSGLTNIETITVQSYEPHVLPAAAAPLLGTVKRRPLSGKSRRDGAAVGAIRWDALLRTEYRALLLALLGSPTAQGRQMYVTTIDELGYWSPFQCFIDRPVLGTDYEDSNGEWMTAVVFTLYDLRLQSVTKTGTYTMTASDRLVYGDTTGGGFTLTLPAASAVAADTIVSVEKIASANTLTIQRAGGDTVNGGTSVALTANRGRFDLVSNGVNAWRSVVV